jgi:hypothetical protein
VVLAAPSLFAWAALGTEPGIALTFTVAALAVLRPRRAVPRRVLVASALASLAGIGFALNLALLTGDAAPWTLAAPFGGGVAVESTCWPASAASPRWLRSPRRAAARDSAGWSPQVSGVHARRPRSGHGAAAFMLERPTRG